MEEFPRRWAITKRTIICPEIATTSFLPTVLLNNCIMFILYPEILTLIN